MHPETLLRILRLLLRIAETFWQGPPAPAEEATQADKVVAQVAPLAEKLVAAVSGRPAPAERGKRAPRPRSGGRVAGFLRSVLLGALAAGGAAYLVTWRRRRLQARYQPQGAAFSDELLDILSAPGGGGRLERTANGLRDPLTGAVYPVLDGIPDFLSTAGAAAFPAPETDLNGLLEPLAASALGLNEAGNAALASAVAASASGGWVLVAPCGRGRLEVELARVAPGARLVCIDSRWEVLLETRRAARQSGLGNLFCVRGDLTLLPVRERSLAAAWSTPEVRAAAAPERVLTQVCRVTRAGALVAGAAFLGLGQDQTDARQMTALVRQGLAGEVPAETLGLLTASGLRDTRAWRDGAFVRYLATRA